MKRVRWWKDFIGEEKGHIEKYNSVFTPESGQERKEKKSAKGPWGIRLTSKP